jgi:hypothetical protein
MIRLHSHRGREIKHPVTSLAGHDARSVLAAHAQEIAAWGRRRGRQGKRARDLRFLNRKMGQREGTRR